jgi:hypothetical protein
LAALVAGGLAVAACTGGDDSGGPDATTSATAATTTTQPSAADDEDAAFGAVERVVIDSTDLAADMYEDPQAALDDPANDDLERYRELFAAGAETPGQTEQRLRDMAAAGQHLRPARTGVFQMARAFGFSAIDADSVTFRACLLLDQETVDAAGDVVARDAGAVLGRGEARREGGRWRFVGVVPDAGGLVTLDPGQANPGYCDIVASANQGVTP